MHTTLTDMYNQLVTAMAEFVEVTPGSRMVQKHLKLLVLVKEESGLEEEHIPYHLRLSLSQPALKTISVRNLYICERSMLKAEMLN